MIEQKIQKDIPLAPLTTFKIGGPAKYFIEIKTKDELAEIFQWVKKNKEKYKTQDSQSNRIIKTSKLKNSYSK